MIYKTINYANQKYNLYLQELENYKKELAVYNNEYSEYLGYMKYIDFQLGAMDLINTPMTSLERTVYSAVMGDTVTKVLSRKDELKIAGVPGSVIDDANDATIQLKSLLPGYFNTFLIFLLLKVWFSILNIIDIENNGCHRHHL